MTALAIVVVVALLILFWVVGAYTRLIGLRNQCRKAYSQIDAQLKRRYDLIPSLVETARGHMKQERETLEAVIVARNQALAANAAADPSQADAMQKMVLADSLLNVMLGKMFVLGKDCPALMADATLAGLVEELTGTGKRIAVARQAYNDGVVQYNASRLQFPGSIIANVFAFPQADLLQATESVDAQGAIEVNL